MFKHNKHKEELKKRKKKEKHNNSLLNQLYGGKNERSGMRRSERAERKTKEEKQSVLEELGPPSAPREQKKHGQIHYNPIIILLSCCILNVFIIPLACLTGIIIHCIRITQQ